MPLCLPHRYLLIGGYGISNLSKRNKITSNTIYIVAFSGGFKCPLKIHFNTCAMCVWGVVGGSSNTVGIIFTPWLRQC